MSEQQEVAKRQEARPGIAIVPPVDVVEDNTGITLTADLPGVPRDKLTVRVDGDGLLIEGEIALDTPEGMEAVYAEVQTLCYVYPKPGARYREERRGVQGRGAQAPHPQGRARETAQDRRQDRLRIAGPV